MQRQTPRRLAYFCLAYFCLAYFCLAYFCLAYFCLAYFCLNTITPISPKPSNTRLTLSGSGTDELEEAAALAAREVIRLMSKINF
jgi:hypothetical protein